jgi:hypothetical protein
MLAASARNCYSHMNGFQNMRFYYTYIIKVISNFFKKENWLPCNCILRIVQHAINIILSACTIHGRECTKASRSIAVDWHNQWRRVTAGLRLSFSTICSPRNHFSGPLRNVASAGAHRRQAGQLAVDGIEPQIGARHVIGLLAHPHRIQLGSALDTSNRGLLYLCPC